MKFLYFYKKNFFEIFFCGAILTAATFRILYPEIRLKEREAMHISESVQWVIIIAELSSVYFLFFTTDTIKKVYIGIFAILCVCISIYYLKDKDLITEIKNVSIFTPDTSNILSHLIYTYILLYIIFIKKIDT